MLDNLVQAVVSRRANHKETCSGSNWIRGEARSPNHTSPIRTVQSELASPNRPNPYLHWAIAEATADAIGVNEERIEMQRAFVWLVILSVIGGTIYFGDCFPSTAAARFRDPITAYIEIRVFDEIGQEISPARFQLQRWGSWQPVGQGTGRVPRSGVVMYQTQREPLALPEPAELKDWVQDHWNSDRQRIASAGGATTANDPETEAELGETETLGQFVRVRVRWIEPVGTRVDATRGYEIMVPAPEKAL